MARGRIGYGYLAEATRPRPSMKKTRSLYDDYMSPAEMKLNRQGRQRRGTSGPTSPEGVAK